MSALGRLGETLATDRGFRRGLLAVTVLALVLRLGVNLVLGFGAPPDGGTPWADQNFFENLAWQLAQGNGFITPEGAPTAFQAPGFPFILSLFYRVFGHVYALNTILQCLFGAGAVWFAGRLAREIGLRPVVALLGATICAVLPTGLLATTSYFSEAPAQFFIAWMSYLVARAVPLLATREGYRRILLAGLVCGYGALVRPQMVILPFILGLFLVLAREVPFWRAAWCSFSFGVAAALLVVPWTIRNYLVLGGFAPVATSGGQTYLSANNPYTLDPADHRFGYTELGGVVEEARHRETLVEPNEIRRDQIDYAIGHRFRDAAHVSTARLWLARAGRLLKYTTTASGTAQKAGYFLDSLLLVPWFLVGTVIAVSYRRSRWRFAPLYIHLVTLAIVTFGYFGSIRYRSAYNPVLGILAAVCVAWCVGMLRGGARRAEETLFADTTPAR